MCDCCYNTPFNTLGIGDPIPAGNPALTSADLAGKKTGTGDLYNIFGKTSKKDKNITKKKPAAQSSKNYGEYLPWLVMS
jgi:hypothetical protein